MNEQVALALFGTLQAVTPARRLSAGRLSCEFCEGQLRNVRWGDIEIVRGISYLLRDQDWGTIPASIDGLAVNESEMSFDVRFNLRMMTPEGSLVGVAHLQGRSDGQMVYEVRATTDAAIQTNRCGFVVLHPAAAAGRSLCVEHTDGRKSDSRFPREISPSQPVFDIRALAYSPSDGVDLQLRLEAELPGDPAGKFEMEDQRNWSDASFKTYVASLLDPWPYVLPAGKELVQRVSLSVRSSTTPESKRDRPQGTVTLEAAGIQCMPPIGVGVPPGFSRACPEEVSALRDLGAGWWIVEANLRDFSLPADLAAVSACRSGLAVRVQLDVIASGTSSTQEAAFMAADLCWRAGLAVDAVRLLPESYLKSFQPSDQWPDVPPLEDYASAARCHFPQALIGGGMYTSFTELNRKRQSNQGLDFIGHLTCPTVHAADDQSVMQTIESLSHIVHTVRSVWPSLGYRIGPTSIAARRNPYGNGATPNPGCMRIPLASVDPRHCAQFGAAWTVAYAAAVAPLELEVLAMHDSHGSSGPLSRCQGITLGPVIVPAWGVLMRLAKAAGAQLILLENLPRGVAGVAWTHDGTLVQGLVANLEAHPTKIRWATPVYIDDSVPMTDITLAEFQVCDFIVAREVGDH